MSLYENQGCIYMSNIRDQIYKEVGCCTLHGQRPLGVKSICNFSTWWNMMRLWEFFTKERRQCWWELPSRIFMQIIMVTQSKKLGVPTQHFWRKTSISTLHTFILGSQNSDIGPTAKGHVLLIIQNSPLNPMASIRSLCKTWLPIYMEIPYLFITMAWEGTFFVVPTLADFALRSPRWRAHIYGP